MRSGREGSEGGDRNRSRKSKTYLLSEGDRGRKRTDQRTELKEMSALHEG